MPSTIVAKSLPWSRLKPRRKYWLALPSPLCCVTIMPGMASSSSAGRSSGLLTRRSAKIRPSEALSAVPRAARPCTCTDSSCRVSSARAWLAIRATAIAVAVPFIIVIKP